MTDSQENISYQVELCPGLIYEHRADGIHTFTFNDVSRQVVEVYCKKARQIDIDGYAADEHVRSIYIANVAGPSPYFIRKTIQLAQETPKGLKESLAIVGNSFVLTVARNVIFRQAPTKLNQATAFFETEEEALVWLDLRKAELEK